MARITPPQINPKNPFFVERAGEPVPTIARITPPQINTKNPFFVERDLRPVPRRAGSPALSARQSQVVYSE